MRIAGRCAMGSFSCAIQASKSSSKQAVAAGQVWPKRWTNSSHAIWARVGFEAW